MTTQLTERKLQSVVKESVKEAFEAQFMRLRASLFPFVSSKEQKEIERQYGTPSKKSNKNFKIKI
jgi:phenylalanyl-tRNA synthetase alpha subunit